MNSDILLTLGIIASVLFILNTVILAIIFFMRRKVAAVSQWPSTAGTVLGSRLERRRSSGRSGSTIYPLVQYSYRVMGRDYQGNVIAPGPELGGSGAPRVVERYPISSQVTVFYDPENPADAVLEKKAPAMFWLLFLVGLFDFILLGVGVLIFFLFDK